MENFKSKFVTAEAAVAATVKDGDWVDYGFGGGYPELLDKALAARKGHLKDEMCIRDRRAAQKSHKMPAVPD